MRFPARWSAILAAFGVSATSIVASAAAWPMAPSAAAPTAKGEVSVSKKGPNQHVDIKVQGLMPPVLAARGQHVYVVWVQPLDRFEAPQNLGALTVGHNRKGELKTITPLDRFRLFITPEPSAQALSPTGEKVLSVYVAPTPAEK